MASSIKAIQPYEPDADSAPLGEFSSSQIFFKQRNFILIQNNLKKVLLRNLILSLSFSICVLHQQENATRICLKDHFHLSGSLKVG